MHHGFNHPHGFGERHSHAKEKLLRLIGRHRRGRIAAFFEAMEGDGEGFGHGLGGRGFRASRLVSAADLQLMILALLAEKSRHGYELIKALEEKSAGFYTPSPGVIYPALTYLEETGHAQAETEGAKKLYSLTEAGQAYLKANQAAAQRMLEQLERVGARMAKARDFLRFGENREEEDGFTGEPMNFRDLRRAFKQVLSEKTEAAPEEQRRVLDILVRALKEIRSQ
ncbi:PadR family transcriptional regulator [Ferrovibrio sp.]|uniref:PadR family transcriptional regulator n=1 Tax=Ferrovibrio sp. TaxID=1917215 RepID=UPI0025BD563F|nr:PadR family transcriptional regulator [Ferrovibrio sp.]MBX3453492.1 PadR family transcriptional regulator [Ferrovibrio sp.]